MNFDLLLMKSDLVFVKFDLHLMNSDLVVVISDLRLVNSHLILGKSDLVMSNSDLILMKFNFVSANYKLILMEFYSILVTADSQDTCRYMHTLSFLPAVINVKSTFMKTNSICAKIKIYFMKIESEFKMTKSDLRGANQIPLAPNLNSRKPNRIPRRVNSISWGANQN